MSGRASFWLLVATTVATALMLAVTARQFVMGAGVSVPPGYSLTLCGWLLGAFFGLGGRTVAPAAATVGVIGFMVVAGVGAVARTWWATRRLVRQLTHDALPVPPELVQLAEAHGLSGRLVLCESPAPGALCFGLLRPRVCLSTGLVAALTPGELAAVLAHESYHVRQRDPLKNAMATMLAAALFPVPLAATLRRNYLIGRELDADRAAMARAGRLPLASAMHKLLCHPRCMRLGGHLAVSGMSASAARLDQVLQPEARHYPCIGRWRVLATAGIATVLLAGNVLMASHSAIAEPTLGRHAGDSWLELLCDILGGDCLTTQETVSCCVSPANAVNQVL